MTPETKSPNVAPSKKRTIVRRVLKYPLLVFLFAITLCSAIAWVRSCWTTDYLLMENLFGSKESLFFGSRQGRISVGLVKSAGVITATYPKKNARVVGDFGLWPDSEGSGDLKGCSPLAFGILGRVQIYLSSDIVDTLDLQVARFNGLDGHGFFMPHALVLIFVGSLFALIALGRRFTLRAFLIWVTIVCILLAIAVRTREIPPLVALGSGQHGA